MRKKKNFRTKKTFDSDPTSADKANVKSVDRIKWGVLAACLVVVIMAGMKITVLKKAENEIPTSPDPQSGGSEISPWIGEVWDDYDIAQWDNGNPWSESIEFSMLPVYRNGAYDPAGIPVGLSQEDMNQRLETAIAALGLADYEVETEPERLVAKADEVRLCVEADGTIEVRFTSGQALPEGYRFTFYDMTDEEAKQALDYLIQEYSGLIGLSEPQKTLSGFYIAHDDDGKEMQEPRFYREYACYDASGDDLSDMLNYHFRRVSFYPDDDGNLSLIRIFDELACAEKLGDYPTISLDEARDLLLQGAFISSCPYAVSDAELIRKAELVYRRGRTTEIFLPYYRFYVEFPALQQDNGLKTYGMYYVPAIQEEVTQNWPLWDGSIN